MATYSITAPSGKKYKLTGPEGATDDQLVRALMAQYPQEDFYNAPKPKSGIKAQLAKGAESLLESAGTGVQGIFDAEAAAQRQQQVQERLGREYDQGASFEKVKERFSAPDGGVLAAGKEILRQVPLAIAEQAPNLAASLGGARLGAMAGSTFGPVGTAVGAIGGGLAVPFLSMAGQNLGRQAEEGKDISAAAAYGTALPQAAAEVVADRVALGGKLFNKLIGREVGALGTEAAEALAKESLKKALAKGAGRTVATEVPTEVLQSALERAQAGLPLTTPDALKEYGESAYGAALFSPVGAVGGYSDRAAAQKQLKTAEEEKARKEAQAKLQAQQQEEAQRQALTGQVTQGLDTFAQYYATTPAGQAEALDQQIAAAAETINRRPGKKATPEEKQQIIQARQQAQRDVVALQQQKDQLIKDASAVGPRTRDEALSAWQQQEAERLAYERRVGAPTEDILGERRAGQVTDDFGNVIDPRAQLNAAIDALQRKKPKKDSAPEELQAWQKQMDLLRDRASAIGIDTGIATDQKYLQPVRAMINQGRLGEENQLLSQQTLSGPAEDVFADEMLGFLEDRTDLSKVISRGLPTTGTTGPISISRARQSVSLKQRRDQALDILQDLIEQDSRLQDRMANILPGTTEEAAVQTQRNKIENNVNRVFSAYAGAAIREANTSRQSEGLAPLTEGEELSLKEQLNQRLNKALPALVESRIPPQRSAPQPPRELAQLRDWLRGNQPLLNQRENEVRTALQMRDQVKMQYDQNPSDPTMRSALSNAEAELTRRVQERDNLFQMVNQTQNEISQIGDAYSQDVAAFEESLKQRQASPFAAFSRDLDSLLASFKVPSKQERASEQAAEADMFELGRQYKGELEQQTDPFASVADIEQLPPVLQQAKDLYDDNRLPAGGVELVYSILRNPQAEGSLRELEALVAQAKQPTEAAQYIRRPTGKMQESTEFDIELPTVVPTGNDTFNVTTPEGYSVRAQVRGSTITYRGELGSTGQVPVPAEAKSAQDAVTEVFSRKVTKGIAKVTPRQESGETAKAAQGELALDVDVKSLVPKAYYRLVKDKLTGDTIATFAGIDDLKAYIDDVRTNLKRAQAGMISKVVADQASLFNEIDAIIDYTFAPQGRPAVATLEALKKELRAPIIDAENARITAYELLKPYVDPLTNLLNSYHTQVEAFEMSGTPVPKDYTNAIKALSKTLNQIYTDPKKAFGDARLSLTRELRKEFDELKSQAEKAQTELVRLQNQIEAQADRVAEEAKTIAARRAWGAAQYRKQFANKSEGVLPQNFASLSAATRETILTQLKNKLYTPRANTIYNTAKAKAVVIPFLKARLAKLERQLEHWEQQNRPLRQAEERKRVAPVTKEQKRLETAAALPTTKKETGNVKYFGTVVEQIDGEIETAAFEIERLTQELANTAVKSSSKLIADAGKSLADLSKAIATAEKGVVSTKEKATTARKKADDAAEELRQAREDEESAARITALEKKTQTARTKYETAEQSVVTAEANVEKARVKLRIASDYASEQMAQAMDTVKDEAALKELKAAQDALDAAKTEKRILEAQRTNALKARNKEQKLPAASTYFAPKAEPRPVERTPSGTVLSNDIKYAMVETQQAQDAYDTARERMLGKPEDEKLNDKFDEAKATLENARKALASALSSLPIVETAKAAKAFVSARAALQKQRNAVADIEKEVAEAKANKKLLKGNKAAQEKLAQAQAKLEVAQAKVVEQQRIFEERQKPVDDSFDAITQNEQTTLAAFFEGRGDKAQRNQFNNYLGKRQLITALENRLRTNNYTVRSLKAFKPSEDIDVVSLADKDVQKVVSSANPAALQTLIADIKTETMEQYAVLLTGQATAAGRTATSKTMATLRNKEGERDTASIQRVAPLRSGVRVDARDLFDTVQSSTENDTEFGVVDQDKQKKPLYSKYSGRNPGAGIRQDRAQRIVAAFKEEFSNAPKITIANKPADVGLTDPADQDAKGAYMNGQVYLFAGNLANEKDAALTLAHEAVGHFGLRALVGNALNSVLDRAYSNSAIKRVADERMSQGLEKYEAVEEALAEAAERNEPVARGMITRVVEALRNILRKFGLFKNMTDNEVRQLLQDARSTVRDGGKPTPPGGGTRFRKPTTTAQRLIAQPQGFRDRVGSLNALGAVTAFIDRYAPLEKIGQALDPVKATQMMYFYRMYGQRMNFVNEVANSGTLGITTKTRADGREERIVERKNDNSLKVVVEALKPAYAALGKETDNEFTLYAAATRAQKVGYAKLNIDPAMQVEVKKRFAELQAMPEVKKAFDDALTKYRAYNQGLLSFLQETGAISKQEYQRLIAAGDYVPYYRKKPDGDIILEIDGNPYLRVGNVNENPDLEALKGGDSEVLPFSESALQNTMLLTDMALKNLANKNLAFTMQEANMGKVINLSGKRSTTPVPNSVYFKIDGEPKAFVFDTEAVPDAALAVKALEGVKVAMPAALRFMAAPARVLRKMVMRNPTYVARQLFRDSMTSYLLSGADSVPVVGAMRSVLSGTNSATSQALRARGITGGQILAGSPQEAKDIINNMISGKTNLETGIAWLDRLAMRTDVANREATYDSFIKQGLSEMEATLATLEQMNFSKQGYSPSLFMLAQTVPFLQSQLTGLNVLFKTLRGNAPFQEKLQVRQKLIKRGMAIAGMTMAYAMLMQDDEAYKNATPEERMNNWFVYTPFTTEPIKVPIPFEAGVLVKAIPEAMYNYMAGGVSGEDVVQGLTKVLSQSIPGGTTPIPLAIKLPLELALNKSMYTMQDIVPGSIAGRATEEQYTDRTTELSKMLGGMAGVSPMKLDYMFRSLGASTGMALLSVLNPIIADSAVPSPAGRESSLPLVGTLFQPINGQGNIRNAYEIIERVESASKSYKDIVSVDPSRGAEFLAKYNNELRMQEEAGAARKKLGEWTKMERMVRAAPNIDADRKQEMLDQLFQAKNQYAGQLVGLATLVEQ